VEEIQSKLKGERNSQALDRLIYLSHQLKGSGGSYGFQRISTEAAELEKAIEKLAKGEAAVPEENIQRYVRDLSGEIDQRLRELATTA
jgi:HPt (histidine-containing phosphotransfer) domain-containing protein